MGLERPRGQIISPASLVTASRISQLDLQHARTWLHPLQLIPRHPLASSPFPAPLAPMSHKHIKLIPGPSLFTCYSLHLECSSPTTKGGKKKKSVPVCPLTVSVSAQISPSHRKRSSQPLQLKQPPSQSHYPTLILCLASLRLLFSCLLCLLPVSCLRRSGAWEERPGLPCTLVTPQHLTKNLKHSRYSHTYGWR